MANAHKVIATAGIVSVGIGTVNSFGKNHTPPSARFLIGSGAAFLLISGLAEFEPEIGQALALAVMTTVLLGEGGGALSYINGKGEIDTQRRGTSVPKRTPDSVTGAGTSDEIGEVSDAVDVPDKLVIFPNLFRWDAPPPIPNLFRLSHAHGCRCVECGGIYR